MVTYHYLTSRFQIFFDMISNIKEGYVKTETHSGVTTIEFFHPQSNSLPGALLEKLAQEIHYAGTHPASGAIVLRSEGRTFCAGASFDELSSIEDEKTGYTFFKGFANVINAIRKCPKIVIARVQGKCVGGGVGLAAAADYAIAFQDASIKLSELAVGIGPFVIGPAVERKIGTAAFGALAIDAAMWRDSDWAKKKGLFAEVHPSIESMDASIERLSWELSHYSADAMQELKKMLWAGTEHWDALLADRAKISGSLVLSDFTRKAIEKFKAKA